MIIKTKFDTNRTYYALCKYAEQITCPICSGKYERKIVNEGFEGVVKCKNCSYGKVNKYFYKIIPFKITYCYWDEDGDPVESDIEVDENYKKYLNHKSDFSVSKNYTNPIYWTYYGCGDYDSDYYVTIDVNHLEKIFKTKEEAEAKLKELLRLEEEDKNGTEN